MGDGLSNAYSQPKYIKYSYKPIRKRHKRKMDTIQNNIKDLEMVNKHEQKNDQPHYSSEK